MSKTKIAHPARAAKKAAEPLLNELRAHMVHLEASEQPAASHAKDLAARDVLEATEWIAGARENADDLWFNLEEIAAAAGVRESATITPEGDAGFLPSGCLTVARKDMFELVQALRWAERHARSAARHLAEVRA